MLDFEDFDAFAFMILKDYPQYVIYAKRPAQYHHQVPEDFSMQSKNTYPVMPHNIKAKVIESFKDDDIDLYAMSVVSGRLWKKDKVISFWQKRNVVMPQLGLIMSYMKSIGENPEQYLYQFMNSEKLIPFQNLNKDIKTTFSQAEIDAKRAEHVKSPLLKKNPIKPDKMTLSVPDQPGKKWWAMSSESVQTFKQYIIEKIK